MDNYECRPFNEEVYYFEDLSDDYDMEWDWFIDDEGEEIDFED